MANNSSFANALYELGLENKKDQQDFLDLSKQLLEAIKGDSTFLDFLSNPMVEFEEKEKFLNDLFEKSNKLFLNFLKVITAKNKTKQLGSILNKYVKIYNTNNDIAEGIVWTTEAIDGAAVSKIEKAVSKNLNKKVFLKNNIDKELIGGIKVEIDNRVWDYSMFTQLKQITTSLLIKDNKRRI